MSIQKGAKQFCIAMDRYTVSVKPSQLHVQVVRSMALNGMMVDHK